MLRSLVFPFEFAKPVHAITYITLPGIGCMVISLILLALTWYEQEQSLKTLSAAQTEFALLQQKHPYAVRHVQPVISKEKPQQRFSPAQQKELTKIADQLTLPWFELLSSFESAQDKSVALLQLSPDPGKHTLSVSGETSDYGALLAYAYRLQQHPALREIHLIQHQVNTTHPQHPVHFELQGVWHAE